MPRRPNWAHGAITACRLWQSSLRGAQMWQSQAQYGSKRLAFLRTGQEAFAYPTGRDSLGNPVRECFPRAGRGRRSYRGARLCPDRRPRLKFVIGDRRPSPREQSGPDSIPSHQSRPVLRSRCAPSRWSRPARPTGSNPALSLVESRVPSQPIPSRPIPISSPFVSRPAALPDELLTGRCNGPIRCDFLGETACPVTAFPARVNSRVKRRVRT